MALSKFVLIVLVILCFTSSAIAHKSSQHSRAFKLALGRDSSQMLLETSDEVATDVKMNQEVDPKDTKMVIKETKTIFKNDAKELKKEASIDAKIANAEKDARDARDAKEAQEAKDAKYANDISSEQDAVDAADKAIDNASQVLAAAIKRSRYTRRAMNKLRKNQSFEDATKAARAAAAAESTSRAVLLEAQEKAFFCLEIAKRAAEFGITKDAAKTKELTAAIRDSMKAVVKLGNAIQMWSGGLKISDIDNAVKQHK